MKIRIKFSKYGSMKFIGHLDVMRYFQKALRRARVDVRYSEGFSPHPIMSFASPLGLGLTSDGEYMDIEVNSTESSPCMKKRLNAVMAEGFEVLAYRRLPDDAKTAMSVVAAADYRIQIRSGHKKPEALFADLPAAITAFLSLPEVVITKKTKKSEREIDLLPLIYEMREDSNLPGTIFCRLASGSENNVKPELVMEALYRSCGLTPEEFDFQIHRCELYARGTTERPWISLAEMGEEIGD